MFRLEFSIKDEKFQKMVNNPFADDVDAIREKVYDALTYIATFIREGEISGEFNGIGGISWDLRITPIVLVE